MDALITAAVWIAGLVPLAVVVYLAPLMVRDAIEESRGALFRRAVRASRGEPVRSKLATALLGDGRR